ncbi:unnamed protein product [Orchesella dallaii]|uniref:Uncharacterized protein n=1 Tax=Orchesella dallaii TaxID=48710 RepID=A0ABP1Q9J3_9HEXA
MSIDFLTICIKQQNSTFQHLKGTWVLGAMDIIEGIHISHSPSHSFADAINNKLISICTMTIVISRDYILEQTSSQATTCKIIAIKNGNKKFGSASVTPSQLLLETSKSCDYGRCQNSHSTDYDFCYACKALASSCLRLVPKCSPCICMFSTFPKLFLSFLT